MYNTLLFVSENLHAVSLALRAQYGCWRCRMCAQNNQLQYERYLVYWGKQIDAMLILATGSEP